MKTSSLFSAAYLSLFLAVTLTGCTESSYPVPGTVSQKQASRQTSSYTPTAPSHVETLSVAPRVPVSPPILPSQSKIKAAILLPLSGRNAVLGQAMLNAAQQAVFDTAGNNFELQPRDTAAEGGAEFAARQAVNGGAQIIIGPLFATDIPPVVLVAQGAGLEMLTLSTDTSLTQRGVYVMGLAPTQQVDRVVAYAAARGAKNFAALIPSTPYGTLVSQEFQSAVAAVPGGAIVDIEIFGATPSESAERAKTIAGLHNVDALFLPESGSELKTITDQLGLSGFDATHTHILGTGLWDVPGLGHQIPALIGAWYAAPDPAARRNFIASYTAAYGQEPPRLATLAYDATALAVVIAKHGARYDEMALTNPNGFAGLDGIFRLTTSGVVERALAINEVTAEGAHVIDPAPINFIGWR